MWDSKGEDTVKKPADPKTSTRVVEAEPTTEVRSTSLSGEATPAPVSPLDGPLARKTDGLADADKAREIAARLRLLEAATLEVLAQRQTQAGAPVADADRKNRIVAELRARKAPVAAPPVTVLPGGRADDAEGDDEPR